MNRAPQPVLGDFKQIIQGRKEATKGAKEGFRPRSDQPPYMLELPLDWDMNPLGDRNWCFQLHAWRMLPALWGRFLHHEDGEALSEAIAFMLDWHRHHIEEGKSSRFGWYDMAAGIRAQHLALVGFLLGQERLELNAGQKSRIDELVELHLAKLRHPDYISHGNHGVFQIVGLQLLSIVAGTYERDHEYSARMMRGILHSQFTDEAVHTENSPYYHDFGIRIFSDIRPGLFPDIREELQALLHRAREHLPWFCMPDGRILNVGDSEGRGTPLVQGSVGAAEYEQDNGIKYVSRDLSRSGYCIVRTMPSTERRRASALYFSGANFLQSHSHADELSFVYFHAGSPLFIDSGKHSYNTGPWRNYFVSDHAHNVVGLADRPFRPSETKLQGSAITKFEWNGQSYWMEGVVRRAGFRHRRQIIFEPGRRILLRDFVSGQRERQRALFLHLAPNVEVVQEDGIFKLVREGRLVARILTRSEPLQAGIIRGQHEPVIQGWFSPGYRKAMAAPVIRLCFPPEVEKIETDIRLR